MPKGKSFPKKFDKDGFDLQHDLGGNNLSAKTQKEVHQTKSLTGQLDDHKEKAGQYDVNIENKNDRDVAKKKSNHQNKTSTGNFFDADFNSLNFINEYLISNKGFKEKKDPHKNKPSNVEDESIVKQHNTNVESDKKDRVKGKKKHKNKLASVEQDDENLALQHSTNAELVDEVSLRKKRKKHKNNSFCEVEDGSLVVQHNTIKESVKEPVKEKKKMHKSKLASVEQDDENLALQHSTNAELVHEVPLRKKRKKHKNNSFCEVEDGSLVVQHNTIEESVKEHVKEKKKMHQSKLASVEQDDENLALQHSTNAELVDEVLLRKKRKKHKNNSFCEVEDGSLVVQHNTIEESVKEPVKEQKKMHKNKLLSTEVYCVDSNSESDVENPSPILNHLGKQKHSEKNKKELSKAILSSSDEEICDIGSSIQFITHHLDFREEPVQFEVPLLHSCESVQQISEEEREGLKSKGIRVKMGRFSEKENALLKRNYEEFTRRFGVKDPQLLLGLGLKYRNKELVQFLKAKHFYLRLGKDLNDRPLCYIYKKARMLFDPRQKHTRLDATKVTHLKNAHGLLGNKWNEIGNIINRSSSTARNAFFWHDEPVNHGKWTAKEEEKLIEAIKTVLGVSDLCKTELEGILWENVANRVSTRNFHQCRLYWFENLSWKFKDIHWDKKDYSKLVSILSRECYVEDYSEIDWKEVQRCFGDLSPSWQFLRKKWYSLKKRLKIRLHKKRLNEELTYKEMLDFLCVKYTLDNENRGIEVT